MAESAKADETDKRILRRLQADGRISMAELSEAVGLSATPVARRVRAMEEAGIITGYRAMVDEVALGYGISVFVSVRLDRQIDAALATFEAAIRTMPEVVDCWLMTGNRDYLMRIASASLADFESFLVGRLTKIAGVSSIESSIPLRRIKGDLSRTL